LIPWPLWWKIIYGIIAFDMAVFGFVLYWEWWRKRGRIQVRVKTPLGEKRYWKKPEDDGKTIVMKKGRGKKPGWKFTFSNSALYRIPRWFGRKALCLDVLYDADKAVSWDYTLKETEIPKWDKKTSKKFIEAETLEKRAIGVKYPMPTLFWLILIIGVVNLGITFLMLQRFGGF